MEKLILNEFTDETINEMKEAINSLNDRIKLLEGTE